MNKAEPLPGSVILTATCRHCTCTLIEDPNTMTWLHLTTREVPCPGQAVEDMDHDD